MARKLAIILLCLSLCVVSTGCWDLQIVDDLALIFAMGFDMVEEDPELMQVTATNPAFSPEADKSTAKRTARGYSVSQALMNMQLQRQRALVLGKINVLVFSEEVARSGKMYDILRELDQRRDMNPVASLSIVKGDNAQAVIQLEPSEETRVAIYLDDLLNQARRLGQLPPATASHFWRQQTIQGYNPVIPVIEIAEGNNGVAIIGLGCVDEQGRLAGILSEGEILAQMLLTGNITRGTFDTKISYARQRQRPINGLIKRFRKDIKVDIVDDKPDIRIKINLEVDTLDVDMSFDNHLSEEIFSGVATALAKEFQGSMMQVLRKTKEWETDVTGIGRHVRIQHPQWFRGRDWAKEYKEATINVEVRVTIQRVGTLINPRY